MTRSSWLVASLLLALHGCGGASLSRSSSISKAAGGAELLASAEEANREQRLWVDTRFVGDGTLFVSEQEELASAVAARVGELVPDYQVLPFPRSAMLERIAAGQHGNTGMSCELPPELGELSRLYDGADRLWLTVIDGQAGTDEVLLELTLMKAPAKSTRRPFPVLARYRAVLQGRDLKAMKVAIAALEPVEVEVEPTKQAALYGAGGLGMLGSQKPPEERPPIRWSGGGEPPEGLLRCAKEGIDGLRLDDGLFPSISRSMDLLVEGVRCESAFPSSASTAELALATCFCNALGDKPAVERRKLSITVNTAHAEFGEGVSSPPPLRNFRVEDLPLRAEDRVAAASCIAPSKEDVQALQSARDELLHGELPPQEMKARADALAQKYPFLRPNLEVTLSVGPDGRIESLDTPSISEEEQACLREALVGKITRCPLSGETTAHQTRFLFR